MATQICSRVETHRTVSLKWGFSELDYILLSNNWENGREGTQAVSPHGGWGRGGQGDTVPFNTISDISVVLFLKI